MPTTPAIVDCPHRVECGACSLLRWPYERQIEEKRQRLGDALAREIPLRREQLLPTLPSPRVSGYRNRAKMTISTDRDGLARLGYFASGTRELVDALDCGVLVPEILETTRAFRDVLNSKVMFPFALRHIDVRCGTDPTRQLMTLVVRSDQRPDLPLEAISRACPHVAGLGVNLNPGSGPQVVKGRIEPAGGEREIWVRTAGLELRVSAGSFFQVNLAVLEAIHERMAEFFDGGGLLLDLYAGVGTHGLALRDRFRRVVGVEGTRSAVADARATIDAGRVRNVEMIGDPIRRAIRRLQSLRPDAAIVNPSAAGAEPRALALVADSAARSLAYLSCNPATLARDLAILTKRGFRLETVQPVDMMPQTRQIEALALLRR